MSDYCDFYDNFSEFDIEINEFKNRLKNSVKSEFLEKMRLLEEENKQLQDIRVNWAKLQREVDIEKNKLEQERYSAKQEAKKARLGELFSEHELILYKPQIEYKKRDKCNNCDNQRYLHFKTPNGKDVAFPCDCSQDARFYVPEPMVVYEFSLGSGSNNNIFNLYYKQANKDMFYTEHCDYLFGESESCANANIVRDNSDFENVAYKALFISQELCQEYCDWKNKKEAT